MLLNIYFFVTKVLFFIFKDWFQNITLTYRIGPYNYLVISSLFTVISFNEKTKKGTYQKKVSFNDVYFFYSGNTIYRYKKTTELTLSNLILGFVIKYIIHLFLHNIQSLTILPHGLTNRPSSTVVKMHFFV